MEFSYPPTPATIRAIQDGRLSVATTSVSDSTSLVEQPVFIPNTPIQSRHGDFQHHERQSSPNSTPWGTPTSARRRQVEEENQNVVNMYNAYNGTSADLDGFPVYPPQQPRSTPVRVWDDRMDPTDIIYMHQSGHRICEPGPSPIVSPSTGNSLRVPGTEFDLSGFVLPPPPSLTASLPSPLARFGVSERDTSHIQEQLQSAVMETASYHSQNAEAEDRRRQEHQLRLQRLHDWNQSLQHRTQHETLEQNLKVHLDQYSHALRLWGNQTPEALAQYEEHLALVVMAQSMKPGTSIFYAAAFCYVRLPANVAVHLSNLASLAYQSAQAEYKMKEYAALAGQSQFDSTGLANCVEGQYGWFGFEFNPQHPNRVVDTEVPESFAHFQSPDESEGDEAGVEMITANLKIRLVRLELAQATVDKDGNEAHGSHRLIEIAVGRWAVAAYNYIHRRAWHSQSTRESSMHWQSCEDDFKDLLQALFEYSEVDLQQYLHNCNHGGDHFHPLNMVFCRGHEIEIPPFVMPARSGASEDEDSESDDGSKTVVADDESEMDTSESNSDAATVTGTDSDEGFSTEMDCSQPTDNTSNYSSDEDEDDLMAETPTKPRPQVAGKKLPLALPHGLWHGYEMEQDNNDMDQSVPEHENESEGMPTPKTESPSQRQAQGGNRRPIGWKRLPDSEPGYYGGKKLLETPAWLSMQRQATDTVGVVKPRKQLHTPARFRAQPAAPAPASPSPSPRGMAWRHALRYDATRTNIMDVIGEKDEDEESDAGMHGQGVGTHALENEEESGNAEDAQGGGEEGKYAFSFQESSWEDGDGSQGETGGGSAAHDEEMI